MIDLRTHSVFSDGTDTPEQLIQTAKQMGIDAIALTDHNTVAGLKSFLAEGQKQGVLAIPGVEFSTEYAGKELHIVALMVESAYYDEIEKNMQALRQRKEQANRQLVAKLHDLGYDITFEQIKEKYNRANINRAHIAAVLTETGQTPSVREAFSTLLSEKRGLYIPPKRPDVFAVIRAVREMGAIPVFAHPFLQMNADELTAFLPEATESGLLAMETYYSMYDKATTDKAKAIAARFGLLSSGGSDHHGKNKPYITLGRGQGDLCVPNDVWQNIYDKWCMLKEQKASF